MLKFTQAIMNEIPMSARTIWQLPIIQVQRYKAGQADHSAQPLSAALVSNPCQQPLLAVRDQTGADHALTKRYWFHRSSQPHQF